MLQEYGEVVNSTVAASWCPWAREEVTVWRVEVGEGEAATSHLVTTRTILDEATETIELRNAQEPWIVDTVQIRSGHRTEIDTMQPIPPTTIDRISTASAKRTRGWCRCCGTRPTTSGLPARTATTSPAPRYRTGSTARPSSWTWSCSRAASRTASSWRRGRTTSPPTPTLSSSRSSGAGPGCSWSPTQSGNAL